MGCQRDVTDELVEKYISGQLAAPLQEDFEVHLLQCKECLERVETLDSLRAGLEERETAIRMMPARPAWRGRWAWSGALAALVTICVVAVLVQRRSHRGQVTGPIAVQQPSPTPLAVKPALPEPTPQATLAGPKSASDHPKNRTAPPTNPSQKTNAPVAPEVAESKPTPESATPKSSTTPVRAKTLAASSLSEEAALELYRLGQVEPAPYVPLGTPHPPGPRGDSRSLSASTRLVFDSAMSAYVEQRYIDAAGMLENVLRADPDYTTARFYLGVCRLLNGRPLDAIDALLLSLQAPVSPLTQAEHYYLGKAYVQVGKLAEAQREMGAAAALPGRLKTTAHSLAQRIEVFRKNQESPGKDKPN